jgi:hypothetical protein
MLFYYRRISLIPKCKEDICCSEYSTCRKEFLRSLEYWNASDQGRYVYVEVPNSCVKRLFSFCTWNGRMSWPK